MDGEQTLELLRPLTQLLSAQGAAKVEADLVLSTFAEIAGIGLVSLYRQVSDGRLEKVAESRTANVSGPHTWTFSEHIKIEGSAVHYQLDVLGAADPKAARRMLSHEVCKSLLLLLAAEVEQRRSANIALELRLPSLQSNDSLFTYADRLSKQIRDGTDALYVAFRLDFGEYRLSQSIGFASREGAVVDKDGLELGHGSALLKAYDALASKSEKETDMMRPARAYRGAQDPIVAEVRERTGDESVGCVAIFPFGVPEGRGVFTLSFSSGGYPTDNDLKDLAAIIASAIAAISVFLGFQKAMESKALLIRDFQVFTNQELIQGYRHAAGNAFELMRIQLSQIGPFLARQGATATRLLDQIKKYDEELGRSLDGMKHLKVYDNVRFTSFDLDAPFNSARDALRDKLDAIGAHCTVTKDGVIDLMGDYNLVRVAFINLILNAIQSFASVSRAQPEIHLVVSGHLPDDITGTFSDNGAGFVPKGNIRHISNIWEVGMTTKDKGTGYGLPLVRFVFQDIQRGSIDVRDYKGGMTFAFRLPRRQPK